MHFLNEIQLSNITDKYCLYGRVSKKRTGDGYVRLKAGVLPIKTLLVVFSQRIKLSQKFHGTADGVLISRNPDFKRA